MIWKALRFLQREFFPFDDDDGEAVMRWAFILFWSIVGMGVCVLLGLMFDALIPILELFLWGFLVGFLISIFGILAQFVIKSIVIIKEFIDRMIRHIKEDEE